MRPQAAYRRRVVEKYYGASGNISQAAIDKAYAQIISNMKKSETNMEGPYSYQAGYPEGDYTNFQEQIVDEVTEKNVPGANEDNMMGSENIFDLGSGSFSRFCVRNRLQKLFQMQFPMEQILNSAG